MEPVGESIFGEELLSLACSSTFFACSSFRERMEDIENEERVDVPDEVQPTVDATVQLLCRGLTATQYGDVQA